MWVLFFFFLPLKPWSRWNTPEVWTGSPARSATGAPPSRGLARKSTPEEFTATSRSPWTWTNLRVLLRVISSLTHRHRAAKMVVGLRGRDGRCFFGRRRFKFTEFFLFLRFYPKTAAKMSVVVRSGPAATVKRSSVGHERISAPGWWQSAAPAL